MFFFLALRNITRNKKHSAVLVLFISVITFLFFIGNTAISGADRNIRRAYTESLTGDVVLQKSGEVTMNLFAANAPVIDEFFSIPVFPAYDIVMDIAASEAGVEGITSQVSGKAYMRLLSVWQPALLSGVDPETYFPLFPGIILEEGRFLESGEYGAMITRDRAWQIEEETGRRPAPGMNVLLSSVSETGFGFKLRQVPLVGIFAYENPGQYMNEIVIVDPQTVRVLNSIQVAGAGAEPGDDEATLFSGDTDDLFGESFSVEDSAEEGIAGEGDFSEEFSPEALRSFLKESAAGETVEETGGDWNFIIIRLKEGWSSSSFISSINKKLEPYGVTAVNWRIAAGLSAILVLLVQALFNAGVFLVSAAGVIAAINILLISVFHRTREIGTLRAIGASDAYIRSLVFCENLVIAFFAGLLGLLLGVFFFRWINSLNLHVANQLIASLLGGQVLRFNLLPGTGVLSLVMAVVLGFAASVYPVEAAVRIEPMAAVRRG